jgi:hypothetical protein
MKTSYQTDLSAWLRTDNKLKNGSGVDVALLNGEMFCQGSCRAAFPQNRRQGKAAAILFLILRDRPGSEFGRPLKLSRQAPGAAGNYAERATLKSRGVL